METKQQALTLSPQQLQVAGQGSFRAIETKAKDLDATSIGNTPNELLPYCKTPEAIEAVMTVYDDYEMTVNKAFHGMNIQWAQREHPNELFELVKALFKDALAFINKDHPWTTARRGNLEVKEMIQYGLTWTIEDFVLFFQMMRKGQLAKHYDKPDSEWVNKCLVAYANLKEDYREDFQKKVKWKAENQQQEDMHNLYKMLGNDIPFMTDDETIEWAKQHRPRTMAEFLGGKSYLSATERAWLSQRDKERRDAKGA